MDQESMSELEESYDYKVSSLNKYEPKSFEDFGNILRKSREENKPVFLDFTALTAVNARKFETNVWSNPIIYPLLNDEFIIVSLVADSRLVQANKENETVGDLWMNYQQERYGVSTQPMYDIVNFRNKSLVDTVANYRSHGQPDLFKEWLDEGLTNFKKENNQQSQFENDANDISDFDEYRVQSNADFKKVLAESAIQNKPVLLYVSGLNIVGYNSTELDIWPDPLVYLTLKNEFIIATVYVDDRAAIPNLKDTDSVRTYGEYWMNYEAERYRMATQPIFDILNHKNESLVANIATARSHSEAILYKLWLEEGLQNFKKQINE